jgi:2-methylcitrate dehydratase PrpD
MNITEELVAGIGQIRFEDLGPEAIDVANQIFLDGFAVMIAGATEPLGLGSIIQDYAREMALASQSSVVAGGFKTSMTEAAFVNGTLAHALDFDNCWYPLNHPTSPTLPVIVAVSEHLGMSGEDCIEALVASFEVQGRLRLASTGLHTGRGFHKPGTTGLMGAVTAAGKLLRLDDDEMLMAFGIAGSRLGSLSLNTGTMTKATHSGNAARMGLEAALLAERGWTATRDVFGPGGYFDTLLGEDQMPELLVRDFASPLRMVDPGVGFKKYPSNYFTHRPIDAALAIREHEGFDAGRVREVVIRFPELTYVDRPNPASGLDGKFSLQYATAAALLDGEVTIDTFTDERRFSDDIDAMLRRVRIEFDPAISKEFLDLHTEVVVRLVDGTEITERVDALTGMPGVPLTDEQRMTKYWSCVSRVLHHSDASELATLLARVELLPNLRRAAEVARADRAAA